jgi:leader peptidase (prepilin peptidase)/N-methyltransferase
MPGIAIEPALVIPVAALLGLLIGSFLNVLILRLPRAMEQSENEFCRALVEQREPPAPPRFGLLQSLTLPASHCPACKTPIRAWDNVPVLSWLLLRGRCRACAAPISIRYPIVEALTGVLSAWVAWRFGATPLGLAALVLTWTLIALTFIDADTQYLPDDLTLPLLWLGLLVNLQGLFVPIEQAVLGAIAGYLALWSIYWVFRLATGREGMGHGDFKLLAALGAWLGWKMLLPIILLSSIVGAVVGIALIVLARHGRNVPIPFGPYLATAGFIALTHGNPLLELVGMF